jgi:hypothetical protein
MENMVPAELDWVRARTRCKITVLFQKLKLAVEQDTKIRHDEGPSERGYHFEANHLNFFVTVAGAAAPHIVTFRLDDDVLSVLLDDHIEFTASVSLCDDGECRFHVGGKPLELWQLRRRALERLFFEM